MRIVFITSAFSYGGAQMSSIELAERLHTTHEVKFIDTYGYSKPFINALKNSKIDFSLLSGNSVPFIVSKHKYKLFNIFRYLIFFLKWINIRKKAHLELSHYQPDIVIVYDDRCLSYLAGFRKKKFKTIFYARSWYTPDQISIITRFLLKNFIDALICISESTRHAIFCGGIAKLNKIFVVHNSINKDKLIVNAKVVSKLDSTYSIIHSGGFLPSKGQLVSLQAAKILKEKNFDFHLSLCGIIYPGKGDISNKYYKELLKYVELNDLKSYVSFVVGENNIISYILNSDIMFFPSSSEGLPRSVLEAMALGKPVIANAVGGVTDLILDQFTGFLTRYNDPEEYARYAQSLMQNSSKYQEIAANALNLVSTTYNETLQIEKINQLFKDLVRSGEL